MRGAKMKRSARRCNFIWNEHKTKLTAPRSSEAEQFPDSLLQRRTAAVCSLADSLAGAATTMLHSEQRWERTVGGIPEAEEAGHAALWPFQSSRALVTAFRRHPRGPRHTICLRLCFVLATHSSSGGLAHKSEAQVCRSQTLGGPGNCLHWASAPGD